jgi:hypothetical protein
MEHFLHMHDRPYHHFDYHRSAQYVNHAHTETFDNRPAMARAMGPLDQVLSTSNIEASVVRAAASVSCLFNPLSIVLDARSVLDKLVSSGLLQHSMHNGS